MGAIYDLDQKAAEFRTAQKEAEALEKALKPFNPEGVPYAAERIIQEAQFFLFHHVKTGYEFGRRLVLLKEHESAQTFAQIIEERFRIPLRTAQFYEWHARLCVQSEKFRAVFDKPGQVCKGTALLSGLSDPEIQEALQEFEDSGKLMGKDEVQLYSMTVRELKAENKRLRREKDKGIKQATEKLEGELADLRVENDSLRAQVMDPGLEQDKKMLASGEAYLKKAMKSWAGVDLGLLATDPAAIMECREIIGMLRRAADMMERGMFPLAYEIKQAVEEN